MYLSLAGEAERWLENFSKAKKELKLSNTELVICPSAIFLDQFAKKNKSKTIFIGAQNCVWENKGAFTGEISPTMLSSSGIKYVILGHSERRKYFSENDEIVSRKIMAALKAGLKPVVCVGVDDDQKRRGKTMEVVLGQLNGCLGEVGSGKIENIIICYEPVWAISANKPKSPPSSDEIMTARLIIKKFLVKKYGEKIAERVRIIYGGSVDSKNIQEVCIDSGMKGGLVGSAGTIPYELVKITKLMDKE